MRIRPYHAWAFLVAVLAASTWRTIEWARVELAAPAEKFARWPSLARLTTEGLDQGVAHRYEGLAQELHGERDIGYFFDGDRSTLWSDSSPAGFDRIQRYYMAQSILAPSLLRREERWPLVVVDCSTPERAEQILTGMHLSAIRDFGRGLILARPGN